MTGLNLLKNITFIFLCLSSFLFTMGVFIPYIFLRGIYNIPAITIYVNFLELFEFSLNFRIGGKEEYKRRTFDLVGLCYRNSEHSWKIDQRFTNELRATERRFAGRFQYINQQPRLFGGADADSDRISVHFCSLFRFFHRYDY